MLIINNLQTRHYKERSNLAGMLIRYVLSTTIDEVASLVPRSQ